MNIAAAGAPGAAPTAASDGLTAVLTRAGFGSQAQRWHSPIDPQRLYLCDDAHFCKVVLRPGGPAGLRRHDLQGEFELLHRCRGIAGVPVPERLVDTGFCRVLIMERLRGVPLSAIDLSWGRLLKIMLDVAVLTWRLAARGVSHDDLRPENVLVADDGIYLVDFDQGTNRSRLGCLLAAYLGIDTGGGTVLNALPALLREQFQACLPPRLLGPVIRARRRARPAPAPALPDLPPCPSRTLLLLHEAWTFAAAADASSPGRSIAYYALEQDGLRFPGERDWSTRWGYLRKATAFRGRRILELGCNMALLSIFLLRQSGAQAALAVDRDPEILKAAVRTAEALGGRCPELRRVDFDADPAWEEELAAFRPHVVFALSVLNWVCDKQRLLTFLARFNEVVFEGHDSARTERRRLLACGFRRIELIATSERGRPVLMCRR